MIKVRPVKVPEAKSFDQVSGEEEGSLIFVGNHLWIYLGNNWVQLTE